MNASSKEKLRHALEWGVRAVTAEWLWDCIRIGEKKPIGVYRVSYGYPGDESLKNISTSKTDNTLQVECHAPDLGRERPQRDQLRESGHRPHPNASVPVPEQPSSVKVHGQADEAKIRSDTNASHATKEEPNDNDDDKDDDTAIPNENYEGNGNITQPTSEHFSRPCNDLTSSHAFPANSAPLTEVSPNPTPKPSLSPDKTFQPAKPALPQHDSLSTDITSLLAHHQRGPANSSVSSATEMTTAPADQAHIPRRSRKRQLFGRAPSNMSAPSLGSRASSVDTMNTDGLGTPLEPASMHTEYSGKVVTDSVKVDPMTFYAQHQDEEEDASKQQLQLTQLGYEDPEVGAWRERVVRKMKGGGQKEKTPRKMDGRMMGRTVGTVKDLVGSGIGSVARRTRHAGSR